MTDTPKMRLMAQADSLLSRIETDLQEMVLQPDLRISDEELNGFKTGLETVEAFVESAHPRSSIESALSGYYWDGLSSGTYADHGERVAARYKKAKHTLRLLMATYGPQAAD